MTTRPKSALLNPALQRPSALDSVPRDPGRLWLDKNENLDPGLMALSREVLSTIPASVLSTYPEAGELYRKLGRWAGVSPECLLLTPGSDGVIRLAFEAFVESGDAVVHTSPTFAMYPVYAQMFGAHVHEIDYRRSAAGPYLEAPEIIDVLRKHKPKLLCLPNPDSPTGCVLQAEVLRELLAECESAGTVMLIDEAYHPFFAWSALPWITSSPNLIVARTFAKAWGAAGMRIGYAAAHPTTIALLHKMRPMYEVSTLAVEFMSRMMDQAPAVAAAIERIKEGKEFFVGQMRSLGFSVPPTEGNFTHVAFGDNAPAVHAALKPRVLYRAQFAHPALAGYSRFSIAPRATMAEVAELIKHATERPGV
jgi:histidinol-phosphate aminotransferase